MEYYSAIKRNTFESVLTRWMNLEPVIQSKVSQKEENKYILMHIYGIWKNGIDEPICRARIETSTCITDLWTQRRKERVGQIKRVALKCMLPYIKDS